MSAFVVGKPHIDAMVTTANAWRLDHGYLSNPTRRADWSCPDDVGRILWTENVRSVQHRYPDSTSDDLPGPCDFSPADAALYSWSPFAQPVLTPVQALKAIACYEYQSCEHPQWEASEAHAFCERLRHEAISRLPGYEDADGWEWRGRAGAKS